jgi:hypothetical protein
MVIENPYITGGMVKDPKMFFGRERELGRIRDRLRKGDCTSVVGLRRMGKSSLLYQLAHRSDQLPDGVVAVYLDLQDAAHHEPLGLLNSALSALDARLNHHYDFARIETPGAFSAAVKGVAADGYRPVLCLDEVEELIDRPAFDDDLFEGLRSLGNQRVLAYVTASGSPLDTLIKQSGRSSEFYNLFVNLQLAGLSDDAARALLTAPFRDAGLTPPADEYVDYVLQLAGHYPFYLQMAASHLFEAQRRGGPLNRAALRCAFENDAESHFRNLWHTLGAEERSGVKRLAGLSATVRDWDALRADLLRCGLAEKREEELRLFSAVLQEMVASGEVERKTSRGSPREPSLEPPEPPEPPDPHDPSRLSNLLAYILIAFLSVSIAFVIARFLPLARFWPFFAVLTVVLGFILVMADKMTGSQFVDLIEKLFGRWK